MKRLLPLLLLLAVTTAEADFNDGVVALMMGDTDKALATFMPLAETSDHAYAQYFLGRMYADGKGVEPDPQRAAEWFRKAAEKGVPDAQFRLGNMYQSGSGVPSDMEYAYAWYSVSGHLGNQSGLAAAEQARQQMSDDEWAQAQKLARDLIQKYGKTPRGTSREQ